MIEKLEPIKEFDCSDTPQANMQHHRHHNDCIKKINELCDAINTIQKEREAERFEIQEWIGILEAVRKSVNTHERQIDKLQMKLEPEKCETSVDPFAEQRRWIGKLCKFWDTNYEDHIYRILHRIEPDDICLYKASDGFGGGYIHCEPVKPDDDIIYKGE